MSTYYTQLYAKRLRDEIAEFAARADRETDTLSREALRTEAHFCQQLLAELESGNYDELDARTKYIGRYYGSRIYISAERLAIKRSASLVALLQKSGLKVDEDLEARLLSEVTDMYCDVLEAAAALFGEDRIVLDDDGTRPNLR